MIHNDPDFLTWADIERAGIAMFRPEKDALAEFGNWCDSMFPLDTVERQQALNLFLRGWQIAFGNWNAAAGEHSIFARRPDDEIAKRRAEYAARES